VPWCLGLSVDAPITASYDNHPMSLDILRELVKRLNPIAAVNEQSHYWSDRPDRIDGLLEVAIDDPNMPVLVLGPRGVGKTAVLNQLRHSLAGNRFVVLFRPQSPAEETSWEELFLEGILWLAYEAQQRELSPRLPFVQEVHKSLAIPTNDPYAAILEFAGNRNAKRNAGMFLNQSASVAHVLRRTEDALAMPVVFLMDISDALSERSRQRLFANPPTMSGLPPLRLGITGPFELVYGNAIRDLDQYYNVHVVRAQPCLDPNKHSEGRAFLKSVIAVRAQRLQGAENLIEPDALETIVDHSAGLPRQLLQIARSAAQFAVADGKPRVDLDAAQRGIDKERERFYYLLAESDIEWLRSLAGACFQTAPRERQALLASNAVVEFWDQKLRRPFWARNPLVGTFVNRA